MKALQWIFLKVAGCLILSSMETIGIQVPLKDWCFSHNLSWLLQSRNTCKSVFRHLVWISSYRCLHMRFLTHPIIFLQSLAGGHAQPLWAHVEQHAYWHRTNPTGGCRKLIKGWELCWTQYIFSVMSRDTLKDWPSDTSLLSPTASG